MQGELFDFQEAWLACTILTGLKRLWLLLLRLELKSDNMTFILGKQTAHTHADANKVRCGAERRF